MNEKEPTCTDLFELVKVSREVNAKEHDELRSILLSYRLALRGGVVIALFLLVLSLLLGAIILWEEYRIETILIEQHQQHEP